MARRRLSRSQLVAPKSRDCDTPDRLPYPCYYLCSDCGWLQSGRTGDPMRHDREPVPPGPCASCSATAWVDLARQSTALAYREAEALDEDMADDRSWGRSVLLGSVLGAATTAAVAAAFPQTVDAVGPLSAAGFGVGSLVTALARDFFRRTRSGRARPRRWRRPLPRPEVDSRVESVVHGVVEGECSLAAPLSGEPCLGWAVHVWNDEGLLLDEQSHGAFSVEGRAFEQDTVTLDLARRGVLRADAHDPAFVRFMRRRGLSPHDSSLRIYEAHLRPSVPVALTWHRSPAGCGAVLSQAPRKP